MNGGVRGQLIAVVIVALLVVIGAWYLKTRPVYYPSRALVRIDYSPPASGAAGPYLMYTFSGPLPAGRLTGTEAVLKDFTVGADSPTKGAAADAVIALLAGGLPFAPGPQYAPGVVATNTLPSGLPAAQVTITGSGEMWFITPKTK